MKEYSYNINKIGAEVLIFICIKLHHRICKFYSYFAFVTQLLRLLWSFETYHLNIRITSAYDSVDNHWIPWSLQRMRLHTLNTYSIATRTSKHFDCNSKHFLFEGSASGEFERLFKESDLGPVAEFALHEHIRF